MSDHATFVAIIAGGVCVALLWALLEACFGKEYE